MRPTPSSDQPALFSRPSNVNHRCILELDAALSMVYENGRRLSIAGKVRENFSDAMRAILAIPPSHHFIPADDMALALDDAYRVEPTFNRSLWAHLANGNPTGNGKTGSNGHVH